jgi:predicted Zn-dependent protease
VVLNSSVPNAWALPGGKLAINRGLLTEMNTEAELAAVLGHEIVHAAARHSAQQMERSTWLQLGVLGTAILAGDSGYGSLATGGASMGAQLLSQSYGRAAELESDEYGMRFMSEAGYDPQGAVALQETFVRLSEGRESDWLSGLFASHPPSQERVRANKATAATLPKGGEVGADRYRAALQQTFDTKPAYDAYDEGRKALGEGNTELALEKADAAIRLFPDEAHFYSLRGDARYASEQYDMAVSNYDIAIRRRDSFFQYFLQRGLAREKLHKNAAAVKDLERSVELYPTAIGYLSLGNLEKKRGNTQKAIEHYSVVAGGQGDAAEAARGELARLDLESNPDKYLQLQCFLDNDGNLALAIGNPTPVVVRGIRYAVNVPAAGGTQTRNGSVPGQIGAGSSVNVGTGIGPWPASAGCTARITAAKIVE